MRVREAVTYRSHGQHDFVYIFSTEGCDRAEGMHLLAYASETRGGHNRKEARPSEFKRVQASSSEVIMLACHSHACHIKKQTRKAHITFSIVGMEFQEA